MHSLLCDCDLCEAIRYHENLANEKQVKVDGLRNEVDGLKNEVRQLKTSLDAQKNEVRQLKTSLDAQNARLANLEIEVRNLRNERNEATTRSTAAEAENRKMKKLIDLNLPRLSAENNHSLDAAKKILNLVGHLKTNLQLESNMLREFVVPPERANLKVHRRGGPRYGVEDMIYEAGLTEEPDEEDEESGVQVAGE